MVPPDQWTPKTGASPRSQEIKVGASPENAEKLTPSWQFGKMDREHKHWGWDKCKKKDWATVLSTLQGLEGMTWGAILTAAGGKANGTNHHPIPLHKMAKEAKDRWKELGLEEFDTVFSLRYSGTVRLYGIRDMRVFRVVWYDKLHGTKRGAYVTKGATA